MTQNHLDRLHVRCSAALAHDEPMVTIFVTELAMLLKELIEARQECAALKLVQTFAQKGQP